MIIDCHGHYTTAPKGLRPYRAAQIAAYKDGTTEPDAPEFTDEEVRATLEGAQLKLQKERGTDVTIFSPIAGLMGHHEGDAGVSARWARVSNDLIRQVCNLYPKQFVPVCQLPQSPGVAPANCLEELERCVNMGFVGANVNPDPSGGYWKDPPLTDRWWYPLWEKMCELDVPGMIHVSGSCNPNFHGTGAHYLCGDTTAFMQLLLSDLFKDFPTLRLVIPHGGGAVPFHWGRYRGLAQDLGRPLLTDMIRDNVFFDTCVYHMPGIELMQKVLPVDNVLFASEMVGAVRGIDPETGHYYDDTKRYVDQLTMLSAEDKAKIFEGNARRVYPRLNQVLKA